MPWFLPVRDIFHLGASFFVLKHAPLGLPVTVWTGGDHTQNLPGFKGSASMGETQKLKVWLEELGGGFGN